jgi:molybdenum cofactor guanylyltransferase
VLETAKALSDDVFVVATGRPEYRQFGVRVVDDQYPGGGTLSGIHTALIEARHGHCFVCGCDMPFVSAALVRNMASLPRDYDVLVPALSGRRGGQRGRHTLEVLHAIYSRSCEPVLRERLRAGRHKVFEALDDLNTWTIPEEEVRASDPDLRSFSNINTPEDVEHAETWFSRER